MRKVVTMSCMSPVRMTSVCQIRVQDLWKRIAHSHRKIEICVTKAQRVRIVVMEKFHAGRAEGIINRTPIIAAFPIAPAKA